jgi:undecaprenyl-diphosphatase
MNTFDSHIILFLNGFAQHSWLLDRSMNFIAGNNIFKGGVLMALFWWAWFTKNQEEDQSKKKETILLVLAGVFIAMFLTKFLALTLPFRSEPLCSTALNFKTPIDSKCLPSTWSSFPSDHATLFFGLTTGLWFISRRLGLFASVYTTLVIILPRLYLGLHYPTDILAGGLLGFSCVFIMMKLKFSQPLAHRILNWSETYPNSFYAFFFLLTFEVATLFISLRHLGSATKQLLTAF